MFKKLVEKMLKREKIAGGIDVTLVNDKKMRALNRRFRKKDRPTDVLSFSYGEKGVLGDVIISRDTTRRNARRYGISYRDELRRLVIHGVLHVLGYDHGREMRHAEKIYAQL